MSLLDQLSDEQRSVLSERTQALSEQAADDGQLQESVSVAVLEMGESRYGVPITDVLEIEPLREITRVPGLDRRWSGVVNLRGSMHAVLDLRAHLGLPSAKVDPDQQKIVLVSGAGMQVGLLADQVEQIVPVPLSELSPPPVMPPEIRPEAIRGVTPDMLTVIDVNGLLDDPRLKVEEEPNG